MNARPAPGCPPQPEPIRTRSVTHPNGGRPVTAILRTWADLEDAARCRLCPPGACVADAHAQCLVVVDCAIPAADAPLYSLPSTPHLGRLRVISAD